MLPLTPVEQRAFDLMKPGLWYDGDGLRGDAELPYTIRRRAHVLDSLMKKGWVEHKVDFATPGCFYSTYSLYRKAVAGASVGRGLKRSDASGSRKDSSPPSSSQAENKGT